MADRLRSEDAIKMLQDQVGPYAILIGSSEDTLRTSNVLIETVNVHCLSGV